MGMHKKTCTVIRASEKKSCKKFGFYLLVSIKSSTFAAEYKKKRLHFSMLWRAGKGQSDKNNSRIALLALEDCFSGAKVLLFFGLGK